MTDRLRLQLELGPKGKRVVAVAPDWPGLERGARTEEAVIERLGSYLPRYAEVARLAGLDAEFPAETGDDAPLDIVERYPGTGSTDFWGISFAFSGVDNEALSAATLERELTLMRACWASFDDTRARVSAELRKGPRGGGRDRDHIVRHVLGCELDWTPRLGPKGSGPERRTLDELQTPEGLAAHREAYCDVIRALHAEGKPAGKWPLRYLIRHTAYHTMDHAWEMVDKDLTAAISGLPPGMPGPAPARRMGRREP